MVKVGIIGHFGFNKELLNGQTIKTKNIANELSKAIGDNQILRFDTHGGVKSLLKLPFQIRKCLNNSENVIILPANRGLRIIVPFLLLFNKRKKRKIHYVVIGGWLPDFCKKNKKLAGKLKKINHIYVETTMMKNALDEQGFSNVVVMPNFKQIVPIKETELINQTKAPFKLCTFSRVMKEKGIEDAINAVILLNGKYGFEKYVLDIYGQIEQSQKEWFECLKYSFSPFIQYKGQIDADKSVEILKDYYALLFPTYYDGEGFAGTILDAMAAGVPVVASDWKYNKEIVNDNNGVLFKTRDVDELANAIDKLKVSKESCLTESYKYLPENVIKTLFERL